MIKESTAEDHEALDFLRHLDDSDRVSVNPWEAKFLESVLFKQKRPLSVPQHAVIDRLKQRYAKSIKW